MNISRFVQTLVITGALAFGTHSVVAQQDPFLGQISIVSFDFAPIGWARCDGQLLPIAQNQALFALIGTTYGGDGRTTFALPDLRGRFPLHTGTGLGLTQRNLGERGGAEAYTMTIAQLPAHAHPLLAVNAEATLPSPAGNFLAAKARVPLYGPGPANTVMGAGSIGSAGGGAPYAVMPPYLGVTYIIALQGIFPSRP